MEEELDLIGHILQDRPDLGYVSEDEEDPAPWPEPIFNPRERVNNKRSHHIKETVQEAEDREIFQSTNQPSFIQQWEDQKFLQKQKKFSRKNWDSRRAWLNARVQEQVEVDYQKKLGTWKLKLEAENDPEVAEEKLAAKTQELQKEKDRWWYQLEHQWELPQGIPEDVPGWGDAAATQVQSSWSTAGSRSAW